MLQRVRQIHHHIPEEQAVGDVMGGVNIIDSRRSQAGQRNCDGCQHQNQHRQIARQIQPAACG